MRQTSAWALPNLRASFRWRDDQRGHDGADEENRALAQEVLSTAYSKGQYKAGLDQLMKEAQAAKQAPGDVRGELRGAVTGNTPTPTAPSSGGGDAGWKVEPVQ